MPPSNHRSIRRAALLAALLVSLVAAGYFLLRTQPGERFTGAREPVKIGIPLDVGAALLAIAHDRGYFERTGLDATLKSYPSGARSMAAMFASEVDVSVPSDIPIVFAAMARSDFRILATISSADRYQKIAARKDRGIQSAADLRGKRVATQKNSAVHYFLYLYLQNYGLSISDITLTYRAAEDLPKALASGEIDAFSMREPFISQARALLPAGAMVVLDAPGLYATTNNLVVMQGFAGKRPETARRLLEAVALAEEFARNEPVQARAIVAKWLGLSEAQVLVSWSEVDLELSLSNLLASGLRNGARWAAAGDTAAPPDFRRLILAGPLRAARREAVTLEGD